MKDPTVDGIDVEQLQSRLDREGDEEPMDMTPMIDMTFLLLIFFTVTASFALQKAIAVPPNDESEVAAAMQTVEELEEDSIVVRVDGDNVYWVSGPLWPDEQRAPSVAEMQSRLREARQGRGGRFGPGPAVLLVQANGDATHEYVVAALDAGSSVGMEEIRMMSYEEGEL